MRFPVSLLLYAYLLSFPRYNDLLQSKIYAFLLFLPAAIVSCLIHLLYVLYVNDGARSL